MRVFGVPLQVSILQDLIKFMPLVLKILIMHSKANTLIY